MERQQEINIQQQEIERSVTRPFLISFFRKEKELESKVRKPAEAEKYRLEMIAKAQAKKVRH